MPLLIDLIREYVSGLMIESNHEKREYDEDDLMNALEYCMEWRRFESYRFALWSTAVLLLFCCAMLCDDGDDDDDDDDAKNTSIKNPNSRYSIYAYGNVVYSPRRRTSRWYSLLQRNIMRIGIVIFYVR